MYNGRSKRLKQVCDLGSKESQSYWLSSRLDQCGSVQTRVDPISCNQKSRYRIRRPQEKLQRVLVVVSKERYPERDFI